MVANVPSAPRDGRGVVHVVAPSSATTTTATTTMADLDDDALMLLAAGGDTRAFATLVKRHEQAMRRFLARLIGAADAPDLCQECFVRLWDHRARYRAEGRFTVFLYRIGKNLAFSKLRWLKVRRALSLPFGPDGPEVPDRLAGVGGLDERGAGPRPADDAPDALALALARERNAALNEVLTKLKPELRVVLVLRHGEGLDYTAIASILGIREDNARARAHRGLVWLKTELARRADETSGARPGRRSDRRPEGRGEDHDAHP
jgi:RNA polymerase sigma-70 factor (ECF subfamily)